MLVTPAIEKLLPKVQNRYALVVLIARRARQLVSGALPLSTHGAPNNVSIASYELDEGRYVSVRGAKNFYMPIRPEVEAARLEKQRASDNAAAVNNIKDIFNQLDQPATREESGAVDLLRQIQSIGSEEAEPEIVDDTAEEIDD